MTQKQLKSVNTFEDLCALGMGKPHIDISHRGGGVGFSAQQVATTFNVHNGYLPRYFGAGCNYLGGGVRGAIFPSTFSPIIKGAKAALLNELAAACVRVYNSIENDADLNDEQDIEGDINWDAKATNAARAAGIKSAY